MAGLNWYKRDPVAFLNGTVGLTLEEKGAYSVILDLIYAHGGPVRDDPRWVAGNCGCSVRRWNLIRDRLVALGKIQCEVGFISNSRALLELDSTRKNRVQERSLPDNTGENNHVFSKNKDLTQETRAGASARRVDKSREEDSNLSSSDRSEQNSNPVLADSIGDPDIDPEPSAAERRREAEARFEEWWALSPRKVGKGQARKAFVAALKRTDFPTLLAGVLRYAAERANEDAQFTVHPATWLNGDRWADDPAPTGNGGSRSQGHHGRPASWLTGVAEDIARVRNQDDLSGPPVEDRVSEVQPAAAGGPKPKRPGPIDWPDAGETVIEPDA